MSVCTDAMLAAAAGHAHSWCTQLKQGVPRSSGSACYHCAVLQLCLEEEEQTVLTILLKPAPTYLPTKSLTMDPLDTAAPKVDLQDEQDLAGVVQSSKFLLVLIVLAALLFTLGSTLRVRTSALGYFWHITAPTLYICRLNTNLPVQGKGKCCIAVGPVRFRQNDAVFATEGWRHPQRNSSINARKCRDICIVNRAGKLTHRPGTAPTSRSSKHAFW